MKGNQGTLEATIETLLGSPVACRVERQQIVERGLAHGRIERRELICSDVLAGEGVFPGLAQIFRLTRERQEMRNSVNAAAAFVRQSQPLVFKAKRLP